MSVASVGSSSVSAATLNQTAKPEVGEGSGPDKDGDQDDVGGAQAAQSITKAALQPGVGQALDITA